jgi:hypothetical protein
MIDWNIQSRAHACQACHVAFEPKDAFHTILSDYRHSYARLDVCEGCWKTKYSDSTNSTKDFVSHWQSIYTPPPVAPPDAIQKETAETLLRKLLLENAPEHGGARFILAVMLERKRLLKVKAQFKQDGQRVFVYEQPKTGDLFNIVDPDLQLDQLEDVQRDVAQLLEAGISKISPPPVDSAPVPAEQTATLQTGVPTTVSASEQPAHANL